MEENELNNNLSDLVQEKIGSINPDRLGPIGLAMRNFGPNPVRAKAEPQNRKERREAEKLMEKSIEKAFGGEPTVLVQEESKPDKLKGAIYRNAKELYVAGAEGEGCPVEKERAQREEVVETTFEYFKRHPKGTFFWEYGRPNFNKVIMAYHLCFSKIRPIKHGEKKNLLIIAKPDSKKETVPAWYEEYEERFSTRSGHLFVSDSESVCGMNHVYSPEKYKKQFLYGDDVKGRVEFLTYQDFEESIDEKGKIWAIREEDEDVVWDVVILDNIDISNPAFFKIKRRYTLCLLPHVSDFPETLPVEEVQKQTIIEEEEPEASVKPIFLDAILEQEAPKKPMEWVEGWPGSTIENLGSRIYGKSRRDLSQEEVGIIVSSLDKLIERIKERQAEEEHRKRRPSDTDSLKARLEWNMDDLAWIERKIREAEETLPDKSFEIAQLRKEEAQEKIKQLEEEMKKEKELKIRADQHDMDHIPHTDSIRDSLGYWKEDLYLAENYYQDEERAQMARQNVEYLQKAFDIMHSKE